MNRQNERTQLSAMPKPVKKKNMRIWEEESLSPPIVNISFCVYVIHVPIYRHTMRSSSCMQPSTQLLYKTNTQYAKRKQCMETMAVTFLLHIYISYFDCLIETVPNTYRLASFWSILLFHCFTLLQLLWVVNNIFNLSRDSLLMDKEIVIFFFKSFIQ